MLQHDRDQKPDRGAGHAGQDPPQRVDLAVARIQRRQDGGDHHRRPDQPGEGRNAAGNAAKARAEHDRQIDDVRTRQEMAQREGLVELLRRHPAVLVDDAAPRPRPARRRSRPATSWQTPRTARSGRAGWAGLRLGDPAPGRRPAGNPGTWPKSRTATRPRPTQFGVFPPAAHPKGTPGGTIFLNLCTLYWGCRFAGYGNKLPSQ